MKQNYEKEKLLLEYLISSPDVYALCSSILNSEYFTIELKNSIHFVQKYFDKYKSLPDPEQILAESGIKLTKHEMVSDKKEFAIDEIERFCRQRALEDAVVKAADFLHGGDEEKYGSMESLFKEALSISLNRDLGIDFLNDSVIDRIEERKNKEEKLPSGLKKFDINLNGGPDRKSIVIFCGVSGGGKSLTLQNFGLNYALQGKTVLYISFELYQTMIDDRFMTMISDFGTNEQLYRKQEISDIVSQLRNSTNGNLFIKYIPTGSKISTIRAYLKEFELMKGLKPDVLCVDYLDLLMPNMPVSAENVFLRDKFSTEELRALGVEYNMLILTASQLNREARKEADNLGQHHVAGGISKVNTADVVMAVDCDNNTKECHMKFLKTRSSNGVGKNIVFSFNPANLRIENMPGDEVIEAKKGFEFKSTPQNFTTIETKTKSTAENEFLDLIGIMPEDYG